MLEKVGIMEPCDEDVTRNISEQTDQKISNSERYYNEEVRSVINYYEVRYHHSFIPVTTEIEKDLYGVWQIKECVGVMEKSDSQGEGVVGDMIIDRIFNGVTDERLESQGFGFYVTGENYWGTFLDAMGNH